MTDGPKLSALFTWRSAIAESDLTPTERLVAFTLSLHMSEMGDSCYPGQERLATETGLNRSTVWRAVQGLEVKGWLKVERDDVKNGQNRKTNRYTATVPSALHGATPAPDHAAERNVVQGGDHAAQGSTRSSESIKPESVSIAAAPQTRRRDEVWEALEAAYGSPPRLQRLRGAWNTATAELREQGATPIAVLNRIRMYLGGPYDWAVCTPMALAKHWNNPLGGGRLGPISPAERLAAMSNLPTNVGQPKMTPRDDLARSARPHRAPPKALPPSGPP